MNRSKKIAAALTVTLLVITIVFAAQNKAFDNTTTRDEEEQQSDHCTVKEQNDRKELIKTAISKYDKYGPVHMMLPMIVTTLTGSVLDGLLAAYLYESYSSIYYALWQQPVYVLRTSDSLVQDPAQALIACILVPMSWRKAAQFTKLYAVGSLVAFIVLTIWWVDEIFHNFGWLQSTKDPFPSDFAGRVPIGLFMAYILAWYYNAKKEITALKRLFRLYLCTAIGSLMAMAGFNNAWIHPFQSTTYWIAFVLLIHYNTVEYSTRNLTPRRIWSPIPS